MLEEGFPSHAANDARMLILGSMPGRASLDAVQYYAHPRNAFWPIMASLFGFSNALAYPQRMDHLLKQHIALWDVARQCIRPGSLDTNIQTASVVCNDFPTFFRNHRQLQCIAFNGRKAAQLYARHVQPILSTAEQTIPQLTLPSTSPAHAAMSVEDKLLQWQAIRPVTISRSAAGSNPLTHHPH